MRILQYNIQSLKKPGNKELLELYLHENSIDIAVLTETWLSDNSSTSLRDFNFAYRNRSDGFGGVGVYIHKRISFSLHNYKSDFDTLIISTLNLNRNISIVCNYSPPNMSESDFSAEMHRICNTIINFNNIILWCGDFNAKAPTWSTGNSNRKGFILEELSHDFGFLCLNDGSPTFSTPNGTRSAIDVTLSELAGKLVIRRYVAVIIGQSSLN